MNHTVNDRKPRYTTRELARSGMIAAIYVVLTMIFKPISFSQEGLLQFRISEALTLMPILTGSAVQGLFIGCLLANLLGGGIWFDVVLGSVATLLAALCTRRLRDKPFLAALMPTLFNGLIVGPVVYFAYTKPAGDPVNTGVLLLCMGAVALGELVVCYALGMPMLYAMRKLPERVLKDK